MYDIHEILLIKSYQFNINVSEANFALKLACKEQVRLVDFHPF